MKILAIDPGLNACGVAVLDGDRIRPSTIRPKAAPWPQRVTYVVEAIKKIPGRWDLLVIELPQVYQGRLQKGDPNDLIKLAVLVGALVISLPAERLLLPTPAEWKGQVPKDIHHRRIREKLPDLPKCSKDAMDAVGLLLYGKEVCDADTKTRL